MNQQTAQPGIMKTIFSMLYLLIFTTLPVLAQQEEITTTAGTLTVTPVLHSTMVMAFNGKTIFVDPYGGVLKFAGFGNPDLILITDIHGDHLNKDTLNALKTDNTTFIVPRAVQKKMEGINAREVLVLENGATRTWSGIGIEALPMYNLPESKDAYHTKGRGNAYILTFADKRLYLSGDTGDIPEMRALRDIDYAFICMNLPYTMGIEQAADAVLAFRPRVVYPFHYRNADGTFSDVNAFKALVNKGNPSIDVRLRDWYVE